MEMPGNLETLSSQHRPNSPQIVAVQVAKKVNAESFPFRREIGTLLGRIRSGLSREAASIINVTSAVPGEGVSTVARELIHAAATMPWCRPLLIDRNPGVNDQGSWLGLKLPNLLSSYSSYGYLRVAAIEVSGAMFHAAQISPDAIIDSGPKHALGRLPSLDDPTQGLGAALMSPGSGDDPRLAIEDLANPGEVMRLAYNLVVIDCPPVLYSPHFLLLAQKAAEVLLVIRAEHTRLSSITEAKEQLALAGCEISGAVMNRWRRRIPRPFGELP